MAPASLVHPSALEDLCGIARATPPGCFVEVGVYQGGSAFRLAEIAREQGRALYLYDTFTGIPFKGDDDPHRAGDFGDTSLEAVKAAIPDAHFGVGIFPATLIPMPPVAFAHVDADQYQSIADAIRVLTPLLVPGGAILFDDYGCLAGADRAVNEWVAATGASLQKTPRGKAWWVKPGEPHVAR